ncbi:MAG: sigma-70 family RNA polymerase sigma factor [Actinomycetota bacterium]
MDPARRLRPVPDALGGEDLNILLALVARGDEAAFAQFYDLTGRMLFGVVLRVVRNPALAEEVTQEAYLDIWRLAPRFDRRRGSARSWASTIAHRRAVDRVRAEQARSAREEDDAQRSPQRYQPLVDMADSRIDATLVREALDELSPAQRDAVVLAYFGGHTYREVAVLLDVPEGTIKTRIRDGLIRLRDRLGVTP